MSFEKKKNILLDAKNDDEILVIPITLDIYSKNKLVKTVEFRQESIVVGRVLSSDIQLEDEMVSRLHAAIEIVEGKHVYVFFI